MFPSVLSYFCAANHWNIVKSPVLMRELWLQMWHDIQPVPKNKFVTKGNKQKKCLCLFWKYCYMNIFIHKTNHFTAKRGPLREADCYWDFEKSQCSFQDYCEYRSTQEEI